jgi:hypothetical protein
MIYYKLTHSKDFVFDGDPKIQILQPFNKNK